MAADIVTGAVLGLLLAFGTILIWVPLRSRHNRRKDER